MRIRDARQEFETGIPAGGSGMDVLEALFTRRSIRRFTPEPVSAEDLKLVMKAAMCAPSAHNKQPWHFIVVRDEAQREAIAQRHPYAKMAAEAPVVIVVCANPEEAKEPGFWQQDCTAALENILVAARGLDLGTVWCGLYPVEDRVQPIRELLGVPAHINMLGLVVMGHPAQPFVEVDRFNEAKIHTDRW